MGASRSAAARAKHSVLRRRLPRAIELRDFDPRGVQFWVETPQEYERVVNHGWETEYTAEMLNFLRPDDVLYDIGGNVGMVCLHAARQCQTVAFEPDPEFAAHLQRSASLNQGLNLSLKEMAIGGADGEMPLFTNGSAGTSPSLANQGARPSVTVKVRSIDSLVQEGLPAPTIVKLDIEGAEILALRGGSNTFTDPKHAPRALFVEVHDAFLPDFDSSADEVLALMHDYGYRNTAFEAVRSEQRHLIVHR